MDSIESITRDLQHVEVSPTNSINSEKSVTFNFAKKMSPLQKTLSQNSGLGQSVAGKSKGILKSIVRRGSAKQLGRQRMDSCNSTDAERGGSSASSGYASPTHAASSPPSKFGSIDGFSFGRRQSGKNSNSGRIKPDFSSKLLEKYSVAELEEFKEVFMLFDKNNTGSIGTNELEKAMNSLGMAPSEMELTTLIHEVDADGNGSIEFEEFCSVLKRMSVKVAGTGIEDIVKSCFQVFDQDSDGMISEREFRFVFREIGNFSETQIDELFKEIDILGNGKIGYDEFAQMVRNYWLDEDNQS